MVKVEPPIVEARNCSRPVAFVASLAFALSGQTQPGLVGKSDTVDLLVAYGEKSEVYGLGKLGRRSRGVNLNFELTCTERN